MLMFFLINWVACGKSSLRNGYHFFLSGGGWGGEGVFLGSRSGGAPSAYTILLTLFQSNIYKVTVRGFLPWDKMDKGMSWGMCSL